MGLLDAFKKGKETGSTQDVLKFAEIRDNTIILKDGNLRQVLLCSSINFSLKSEQEQNALVYQYQNFLNSLNFPVQILLQSKRLDLSKYLEKLDKKAGEQTNELLKMQTEDYISFIKKMIELANIMDKKFFVVVPYMVPPKAPGPKIPGAPGTQTTAITITPQEYEKYRTELEQRVQVTQAGLGGIGLRSAVLNTQQLIELIYGVYNPEEASKEKIVSADQLQGEVVSSVLLQPEAPKTEKGKINEK